MDRLAKIREKQFITQKTEKNEVRSKKCSKNIPENYIIFQKVGDNFSNENKVH
jgi:hypothetical protein